MLSIKRTLQSDLKNKETKLEKINNEIAAVEEEIGKCSILQMSKKKTLQSELENIKTNYNAALSQIEEVEERIRFVADIIDPVDKKIEDYRTKLYGTVAKFEFNI
jgi:chromosome segregation ATPase